MRYRLRTLLIVLAVAPPVLAGAWLAARSALRRFVQTGIEIPVHYLLALAVLVTGGIIFAVITLRYRRA
jgi:hypothetical protein